MAQAALIGYKRHCLHFLISFYFLLHFPHFIGVPKQIVVQNERETGAFGFFASLGRDKSFDIWCPTTVEPYLINPSARCESPANAKCDKNALKLEWKLGM